MKAFGINYVPTNNKARFCLHFDYPSDFTVSMMSRKKSNSIPKYNLGSPKNVVFDDVKASDVRLDNSKELDYASTQSGRYVLKSNVANMNQIVSDFFKLDVPQKKCIRLDADMCRLCLRKSNNVPLFENDNFSFAGQRLSRLIQMDLEPDQEKLIPSTICRQCNYRIDLINEFQQTITEKCLKYNNIIKLSQTKSTELSQAQVPENHLPSETNPDHAYEYTDDSCQINTASTKTHCRKRLEYIKCPICKQKVLRSCLRGHYRRHSDQRLLTSLKHTHFRKRKVEREDLQFKCHSCRVTYKNKGELQNHLRSRTHTTTA